MLPFHSITKKNRTITEKLHIDLLKKQAKDYRVLTINSLSKFYQTLDPYIKPTTINWRIHELVKKGILERISRGKFRLGKMTPYVQKPGDKTTRIYHSIQRAFPYSLLSIWETNWINEFSQHLTNKSFVMIETDKDSCESVFYKLQEEKKSVFLDPPQDIVEKYVAFQTNPIIVKSLITESPLQRIGNINMPTIEKILVDLYCDNEIFYFFQGRELEYIWKNAFEKYSILQDKLLRYASRRRKKSDISTFMNNVYNPAAN